MPEPDSTSLDQLRSLINAVTAQVRAEQALARAELTLTRVCEAAATLTSLREIAEEDAAAEHDHPAGAADAYKNAEHLIRTALNEETT